VDLVKRAIDDYSKIDLGKRDGFEYCFSEDDYADMYSHFEESW
jgi:hypothetical protein